jgi:ubiquinone/menaquinone biosynthesis C-methylase UbiE
VTGSGTADDPAAHGRTVHDSWTGGRHYESYVGRWSRLLAREFLDRLDAPAGARWLDVGSGTGALTEAVLGYSPRAVLGVDASADFVAYAAGQVRDPRASFAAGDAQHLPVRDTSVDVVVSGLMLNFLPDRSAALREMRRVSDSGGVMAAYVWDYAGLMQLMSYFWDTAAELQPAARSLHEGVRFGFCRPEALRAMVTGAGFTDVTVGDIVVPTVFRDFDDYWTPFLSGHAPAPAYAMSLDDAGRAALRDALRERLPTAGDGTIPLTARAWVVSGHR